MASCVIFGGAGFIGTHLARALLADGRFRRVVIADLAAQPALRTDPRIAQLSCDVRAPIAPQIGTEPFDWVFNLAAVHREPEHRPDEYHETNLLGAENVCFHAVRIGCPRIVFTSSTAVYGETDKPATESSPLRPVTPYGGSKLGAERIHRQWLRGGGARRLVVARPGVVYGPGDTGNVPGMIRAIRRGRFVLSGARDVVQSSAYVFGLVDALLASLGWNETEAVFNYVDHPSEPLERIVEVVKGHFGCRMPTPRIPLAAALAAVNVLDTLTAGRSPLRPFQVKKTATSTCVKPQWLLDRGWPFRHDFAKALADWQKRSPEDFATDEAPAEDARPRLVRRRAAEGPAAEAGKVALGGDRSAA